MSEFSKTQSNYKVSVRYTHKCINSGIVRFQATLIWIRTCFKCKKAAIKGNSNKCKRLRDLIISTPFYFDQTVMLKMMTSKERELRQPTVPFNLSIFFFPFSLSLLISKPKSENVCTSKQNSKTKTVEFILSSLSTIPVRTKYMCMYEIQNTNCIILLIQHIN